MRIIVFDETAYTVYRYQEEYSICRERFRCHDIYSVGSMRRLITNLYIL